MRSADPASRVRTRERLIRHGTALLTEFSFDATGIDRLLREVGVPKGSFYHYFPSKQAFVMAVIDNYVAYFERKFDRLLGNLSRTPLQRLQDWIGEARLGMARHHFRRGCLVGNLAQELGAHDDQFRARLEMVFQAWQARVRGCLTDAVAAGQLSADADPAMLAEFFWI
ncbi:MAG: TetR family transcriptional regulator C-terminal domain-containing protein, partial [Burkholderiaceae bacterium]|nr:TetR family transcriptional regulator C-terminal domain-containing protein [Burkholderiaceae bacterium]